MGPSWNTSSRYSPLTVYCEAANERSAQKVMLARIRRTPTVSENHAPPSGTCKEHEWTDTPIAFTLRGMRLSGKFRLVRPFRGKPRDWTARSRAVSRLRGRKQSPGHGDAKWFRMREVRRASESSRRWPRARLVEPRGLRATQRVRRRCGNRKGQGGKPRLELRRLSGVESPHRTISPGRRGPTESQLRRRESAAQRSRGCTGDRDRRHRGVNFRRWENRGALGSTPTSHEQLASDFRMGLRHRRPRSRREQLAAATGRQLDTRGYTQRRELPAPVRNPGPERFEVFSVPGVW